MSAASEPANQQYDAVVVGAGLGGLSSAAYLAAAGRKVLLLERYTALGGSSHVFRRQGKWEFDCGVHFVGDCAPGGIVPAMMGGLGIDDRVQWLPLQEDSFNRIIAPDEFQLNVPVGWDNFLIALETAFPDEKRAVRRYHAIMRKLSESIDRRGPHEPKQVLAQWGKAAGWAAPFIAMPYVVMMKGCGLSNRAIYSLSVECGALASSPSFLPTVAMAAYYQDYIGGGTYYPRGGGQVLAAAFTEVITSHGGEVRTKAEVERILVSDGVVTGVKLAGGDVIRTSAVVSDADIIKTFTDLVGLENLPRLQRERVKRWRMSQPLINGFFGVEYDMSQVPNSNYFAIPTWEPTKSLASMAKFSFFTLEGLRVKDGSTWAREMAANQPMFLQSSSQRDPGHGAAAPAGHATIEVQTITPSSPGTWGIDGYDVATGEYSNTARYNEIKKIVLDGMMDRMEQSYPGSTSNIKIAELGTPATQTRYVNNSGGAPFGLATRLDQAGPLRPGTHTAIKGLFLAGTSTAWGPGTVGSMLSGVHAASAITGRDLYSEITSGGVFADTSLLSAWPADFDSLAATRGFKN